MKRKAHTDGRAQGQAEANRARMEWLRRKEKAEANDQTFRELPPDSYY